MSRIESPPLDTPILAARNAATTVSGDGERVITGTSRATGRPCLVMITLSPFSTFASRPGRWVLASYAPIEEVLTTTRLACD
jgi:non-ribosomal peptide synthetase component F